MGEDDRRREGEKEIEGEERRDGDRREEHNERRPWLWGAIGLASVLALALLFSSPRTAQDPNANRVRDNQLMEQTPPGSPVDFPNSPGTMDSTPARVSDRVTNAAKSVEGVEDAYGIAAGTTALVGLDLSNMIKGQEIRRTEEQVADQVEELTEINRALVTSDPDLVTRIQDISRGVAEGRPIDSFTNEIADITRSLTPTGSM